MKYVEEYRDGDTARAPATKIAGPCEPGRRYSFMEICGGHTHTSNPKALAVIDKVMEVRETFEWRGLGWIPDSAVRLREEYAAFDDAERIFQVPQRFSRSRVKEASGV